MSTMTTLKWPCGCHVVSMSKPNEAPWELFYCPLHGAAEELRDACKGAERAIRTSGHGQGWDSGLHQAQMTCFEALASAEPKPKAAEAVTPEAER